MRMKDFILDDTYAPSDQSLGGESTSTDHIQEKLNMKLSKEIEEQKNKYKIVIDKDLIKFKAFFLLFFAGFGSTFPYLGVYFKQLGLNATFVGILAGVRPLIQFISGPFWALLADKYKARKTILLFSILAWLVMTLLLAFPRPHKVTCKAVNITKNLHEDNSSSRSLITGIFQGRHFGEIAFTPHCVNCYTNKRITKRSLNINKNNKFFTFHNVGNYSKEILLNIDVEQKNNIPKIYDEKKNQRNHKKLTTKQNKKNNDKIPKRTKINKQKQKQKKHDLKYTIERDNEELRNLFYVFLTLIVVGEFLEAPSFIMIDTALLEHLGHEKKHYGKTRLFGSIGYGTASFCVGALLDKFQYEFCGKQHTNYMIVFYLFTGFMIIGFGFGLFFVHFKYQDCKEKSKPMECVKLFLSLRYGSFLTICWFCGFCHGSIMNFLNWYLEDLGATKLMMGVATACRCSAIISGFFMSSFFIERVGHVQLICWAVFSYVVSYFAYAAISNPWLAIPVEVIQGLIYAISWSSCITYLGEAAPPNTAATMQGILQGVYWGLGTGTGAIAGGILINHYGVRISFRIGGVVGAIVFSLYCLLQVLLRRSGKS